MLRAVRNERKRKGNQAFAEQPVFSMYVDVRGPNPVLVDRMSATVLHNAPRNISVPVALTLARRQTIERSDRDLVAAQSVPVPNIRS